MIRWFRRYIFTDFRTLQKVGFEKLDKVCEKVFILIAEGEDQLDVSTITQAQPLGKKVNWVPVLKGAEEDLSVRISFLMGSLHKRLDKGIEFAILSDDKAFDSLVLLINEEGRSCIRIRVESEKLDEWVEQDANSESPSGVSFVDS